MLLQSLHDHLPDLRRRALPVWGVDDIGLGLVDDLFELSHRNRTLLARLEQSGQELLTIKFLSPAVLLYDHVRDFVDALVRGKALLTLHALATAADRLALFGLARIHYFVI